MLGPVTSLLKVVSRSLSVEEPKLTQTEDLPETAEANPSWSEGIP